MKTQTFGIELETTGLGRARTAQVLAEHFGTVARHVGLHLDNWTVAMPDGRHWTIESDASVTDPDAEVVSPVCRWEDIPMVQEVVRALRRAGAMTDESCGIHIHVGLGEHTPQSLRRLVNIRVNDPHDTTAGASGTTWVYNYDRGGNILSKSYYAYTTGTPGTAVDTIAYSYTDSNWKDKLTAYDGQTITYDAIGNPLSDGTWMYTWEKGRQLKQMSKAGMTVEFKYDHNGLRTQKKVTSGGEVTTTEYTLHGKLVTHLTRGSDEMHFFYDAQSRPAMVDFNGALYSYVHNLQGDVVGIVDSAGSFVVEYKYDAWGNPTLVRTLTTAYETLAELNPFRYRGYVYDEETGLHYLKARYYCSSWHRFLNPDAAIYDSKRIGESNLYTYCSNRPVVFYDPTGESIKAAIMAFIARWLAKFIGMIIGGQDGDKEYNNSYDPEDTDPTKPRNYM